MQEALKLQHLQGGDNHAMPDLPDWRQWDIIDLPNVGRESNTFAEHLVRRYDSLASYTIFSQVLLFRIFSAYLDRPVGQPFKLSFKL